MQSDIELDADTTDSDCVGHKTKMGSWDIVTVLAKSVSVLGDIPEWDQRRAIPIK